MELTSLAIFLWFRDSIKALDGKPLDLSMLAPVLSKEAEKRGANCMLLSLIGSWGDTLTDKELFDIIANTD